MINQHLGVAAFCEADDENALRSISPSRKYGTAFYHYIRTAQPAENSARHWTFRLLARADGRPIIVQAGIVCLLPNSSCVSEPGTYQWRPNERSCSGVVRA